MARLNEFEHAHEINGWAARNSGTGAQELIADMVVALNRLGWFAPQSPAMRAILEEDRRKDFIAALDTTLKHDEDPTRCGAFHLGRQCILHKNHDEAHVYVRGTHPQTLPVPQNETCGTQIPGSYLLRCNRERDHDGHCQWSRPRAQAQEAARRAAKPMFHEADPELERLLREETEILRRTKGDPEADPVRHEAFAQILKEKNKNLTLAPKGNVTLPPMAGTPAVPVPGAPPLAPGLHGKTMLPPMPAPAAIPPHGTHERWAQGCICIPCCDAQNRWMDEHDDYEDDYYEEPDDFDN